VEETYAGFFADQDRVFCHGMFLRRGAVGVANINA
jgi:hypothetical protein